MTSIIIVLDGHGEQIYSTGSIKDKESYQVIKRDFDKLPWEIHVMLSETEQAQKINGIYIVGGSIILVGVLVIVVLYMNVSKLLTKPLTEMLTIIRKIEGGDLALRFDENGDDEFAYLRHSLNKMLDQINKLIEQEYQMTIEKQTAEFHALQSQIQPHYLYNTLTGLIGLNRLGEKAKLETSILNLTKQMRYILEQDDVTTIGDEISLLQSYCALQQLRFGDRIHFDFKVDRGGLEGIEIPKLLLQPTVENAIIHGLEKKSEEGHLKLSVYQEYVNAEDDSIAYIVIDIVDDGVGFDTEAVDFENSVGIANTINRLKLMDAASVYQVNSAPGQGGTRVRILIPYTGGNNNENTGS